MVDSMTQVELKFPDELTPDELDEFKVKFSQQREAGGY
jgi:hypothetical protein